MNKNPIDSSTVKSHPSYGAITLGRRSSGAPHPMYGSSVKHRDTIRLTLHHGECKRMLSGDWYSPKDTIVEVEMTQNQWAELVSSIGLDAGVPCTIKWLNGPVEDPPFQSKVSEFQAEFQACMDGALSNADEMIVRAKNLLGKKTLTKADRDELLKLLQSIQNSVRSQAPFIYKQFAEQMEKTATEVKGELEAWQLSRITELAAMGLASKDATESGPDVPPIEIGS